MILTKGLALKYDFVSIEDIQIIQEKVSEQISTNFLYKFITTSIVNSKLISSKYNIYYKYIQDIDIYNIYLLPKINKEQILIPYIFTVLYSTNKLNYNENHLFIAQNYFVVYINGNMQCFNKIEDTSTNNDIKYYVNKHLKINIDTVYEVSKNYEQEIKEQYISEYNNITKLEKLEKQTKKNYIYIVLICVSLAFLFAYIKILQPNKSTKKAYTIKVQKLKLPTIKAIVNQNALIDNIWYKKDDSVSKYLIENITNEYVNFKYLNKTYKGYIDNK
jgi:phosphopantetheine adenylyltransferase